MTTTTALTPSETRYVDVNGVHMYVETYGDGTPLVLLHGGLLTIELNFAGLIPTLAQRHRVIGVELQGHGRTATGRSRPPRWPATSSPCWTSSASSARTSSGTAWARRSRSSWR